MAVTIRINTKSGKDIIYFGESVESGIIFDFLQKLRRENRCAVTQGECYLNEIYRLEGSIAVPFLLEKLESFAQRNGEFLKDQPDGRYEFQKMLLVEYLHIIEELKNAQNELAKEVFIFDCWDGS